MVTTLVDSNVLIDLLLEDSEWFDWSAWALARSGRDGRLVINQVVYAEVSCTFHRIEDVEEAFPQGFVRRESIPMAAAFVAGQAFTAYRRRGGTRRSPLPDFFIGAHAAIAGYTLLTRDATRYRTYFPKLRIIAP
jgi:predicted nucleic acid-binding protein